MNKIRRQGGYTVVELMVAVSVLISIVGAAFVGYTLVHFIAKYW
jgi:type II secretory pathway component PulJ